MDSSPAAISTHTFQDTLLDVPVTFLVLRMTGSLFVWVGEEPGKLEQLAVAMTTRVTDTVVSSRLMGHSVDDLSGSLAVKLSRRMGKQVFASCNVSMGDSRVLMAVTQRLLKECEQYPDKF